MEKTRITNILRLIEAVDEVAGILADDIIMLKDNQSDEEIDNKLVMMGSKKNKTYQKYLDVLKEVKNFKAIVDISNELDGKSSTSKEKVPQTEDNEVIKETKPRNISDLALTKKPA